MAISINFFRNDSFSLHRCGIRISAMRISIPILTHAALRKKMFWSMQYIGVSSLDQPVQTAKQKLVLPLYN